MRIALVLRTFGKNGGTERYTTNLAGFLLARGHEVHVHCARYELDLSGVVHHPLPDGRGMLGMLALDRAARRIELDAYDVVQGFGRTTHHHVFRAGGGSHAAYLQAMGRRAWTPRDRLELRIDRRAVHNARVVICNSEMAARQVRQLGATDVRVVRNGVDAERFRPDADRRAAARSRWGARGRVALFAGNGFRRKGLRVAAEAFAQVAGPEDRFVVVGHDAHAQRYLRPVRSRLGSQLIVEGGSERPEELLPGADATLLPTLYDSAANTTFEALSCGVPPVTSGCDGSSEIVGDRRLVVENPRDVEGFAVALRYAWEGDFAQMCRDTALAWPVSRNGEEMERIYEDIVG